MRHSVIAVKYGLNENGWDTKPGGRVPIICPWKNTSRIYSRLIPYARYDMGKWNKIKFWEDKWWGEEILASRF